MKKTISIVLVLVLGMASIVLAAEDTWITKADIPTARQLHCTNVVDGKIYAIGGATSEPNPQTVKPVEVYDPITDSWTQKADIPTGRAVLATSVVDGKIYAVGGAGTNYEGLTTLEVYDPATDTWTRKADMPTPRAAPSASAVNGKLYVIGGTRTLNNLVGLPTVEEYNPSTDTWTRKADMPTPKFALCTSVVDGQIYAIGGGAQSSPGRDIVEAYDPATDTWTRKANMPTARRNFATCVVGGRIYAIGGWVRSSLYAFTTVERYDPVIDAWTIETDLPVPRASLSASAVNGRIYAIGGTDKTHPCPALSTVYELSIDAPPPDFNGDGIVDAVDMYMMVDYWGTDEPLYDIAPQPFGDGIVDVQDLIVLAEHLFEVYPWAETIEVNEADNGGQIELELGKLLVVTLESNPSTGYRWELVENNESFLKQFGQSEYKPPENTNPRMVGAGGWEIFRFKAVSAGQTTLEFVYHRSWEDAEPLKTFSIQVTVN